MSDDPEIPSAPTGPTTGPGAGSYGEPSDSSQEFDKLTRGVGGLASRRTALRVGGAAILAAAVAWFVWGRGRGSECATGSVCGERHYCNDEQTCLCTLTTEGDLRCGQYPEYCNLPLCTTSADCAHMGEGWFCDTPHSGCCSDPPAELSRCIAPCGTAYPPPPTTTTTTTEPSETEEPGETEEPEEPADDGEPAHLRRTLNQEDGLLFFSRYDDGSGAYYFGEVGRADRLELSHVVFQGADGATASVIVNADLLPVSWVAPRMSIAARSEERDTPLDPTDALHAVIIDAEETTHRIDLIPTDLVDVLRRSEVLTKQRFPDAHAVVDSLPADWAEVVGATRTPGEDQPQRLANAVAISIAHAAIALLEAAGELPSSAPSDDDTDTDTDTETDTDSDAEEGAAGAGVVGGTPLRGGALAGRAGPSRSRPRISIPGGKVMGPVLESMVKNALLNLLAEELFGPETPTDPTVPTVDLLLCQGATSWGLVCHYAFFNADDIMGCLDFCKTDLGCYTNICMPVTLSVKDAQGGL